MAMRDNSIAILGGRGMLGSDLASEYQRHGLNVTVFDLPEFDITNTKHLKQVVSDAEIMTSVYDYAVPSRDRPALASVNYEELKSGMIEVNRKEVRTSPLSSFKVARDIALQLKDLIARKEFFLTEAVKPLSSQGTANPLRPRKSGGSTTIVAAVSDQFMHRNTDLCIDCGLCVPYGAAGVFQQASNWIVTDDRSLCVECGECRDICPQRAITVRG